MSEDLLRDILREANKRDLFRRILGDARNTDTLVQVYANPRDLDQYIMGFVRSVGDDTCVIQELTWEGLLDGTTAIALREVVQISQHTRRLCRLRLLNEQQEAMLEAEEEMPEESENCLRDELQRAQRANVMVNCRIATNHAYSTVNGFVRDVLLEYVQIDLITPAGEPDGVATLRMKDFVGVSRNDRHQLAAMVYYRNRKGLYDSTENVNRL